MRRAKVNPWTMRYFILVGGNLAVGAAAIFARFALEGAGYLSVSALRLAIAALAVRAIVRIVRPPGVLDARDERLLAWAGIALALHFAMWIGSLNYLSVATATLLVCCTPLWSSLYEALVLKASPPRAMWFAMAGGAAGIVLLVHGDTTTPPVPGFAMLGSVMALTGSIAIGAYFFLVREVRPVVSTWTIVARTYTWSAIALAIGAVALHQAVPLGNGRAWFGILAMALLSQLCGHTLFNLALRYVSPSTIAISTLLEPVVAGVLAVAIFSEKLPPIALGGGVIVLICVGVALRSDRSNAPALAAAETL